MIKRILKITAALVLFFIIFSVFYIFIFKFLPLPSSSFMIQNRISNLFKEESSEINYEWVSIDEISPNVILAVIASEDQKFTDHYGFDFNEIMNAFRDYRAGKRVRGASTITQQTAKNLFLWKGKDFFRKGLEVYFTVLLELIWSKERIIEVYLNIAEFGNSTYGISAASSLYFGKNPSKITEKEAALLAAVLPNPHRFSVNHPSLYIQRRVSWIRKQMRQIGKYPLDKL